MASRRSKKHLVENEVAFDDLVEGEKYNIKERTVVPRSVHNRHSKSKVPDKIKIISYIGTLTRQQQLAVWFDNVTIEDDPKKERLVMKEDVVRISRFDFPGLPNELRTKINSFSKPTPKKSGYKPFIGITKLSPGDHLVNMDGIHTRVTRHGYVPPGGIYEGKKYHAYRQKSPTMGGTRNTRTRKHKKN